MIYKILDQQAIEATDNNPPPKADNEEVSISSESNNTENNTESDSAIRRGKRPRTLKPVIP